MSATAYSQISEATYGLKHNAKRAASKVAGAVVFADGDAWRWGVPAEQAEEARAAEPQLDADMAATREQDAAQAEHRDAQEREFLARDALLEGDGEADPAEQHERDTFVPHPGDGGPHDPAAQGSTIFGDEDEEADDRPRHERLGVDDALIYGAECLDAPAPVLVLSLAPGVAAGGGTVDPAALLQAARDQVVILRRDHQPAIAWLIEELVKLVPAARPERAAPKAPRSTTPRQSKADQDLTIKPIITSATNQGVQKLIDRIDAARGDAAALRAFKFARSSTYYQKAGRFLDALLDEAEAAPPAAD